MFQPMKATREPFIIGPDKQIADVGGVQEALGIEAFQSGQVYLKKVACLCQTLLVQNHCHAIRQPHSQSLANLMESIGL